MTPDQHARAKELFLKARELEPDNRAEFLQRECGDDTTVLHDVTSLLRYDSSETILTRPSGTPVSLPRRVGRTRGRLLSRIERAATGLIHEVFINPRNRRLVFLCSLVLLLGLALWMYMGMRQTTESIAATELRTILNAEVKALELWVEEKEEDIRLWSSLAVIRRAVSDLIERSETESDPTAILISSPALADLRKVLEQFDRIEEGPEREVVVARDGLILAAGRDEHVGMRLSTDGIAALAPVFQGQTVFLKPHPKGAFGVNRIPDLNAPMVHVVAPIRSGDSEDIIAAAAFGFPADDEFTRILSVARLGQTGETYIFDEDGVLLSESRFDEELRASGQLPLDAESRSIFRIEIREPVDNSTQAPASSVEAAAKPLTQLAAKATAAGRKGSSSEQQGVVLEPYLNYRGARVIGAWRWLPAYSFAVATEVEVDEQYEPMRYPLIAVWICFGLLTGCVVTLLGAATWIAILGRDVQQAMRLGQYTLEEKIGEGGMGAIYRARHELLRRETAIKLLRPEIITKDSLARFEREVQLASSLTHPNTIDVFDFGLTPDGSFYCAMELLNGQSLEDLVSMHGPLQPDRALNILRQLGGSLKEAHQRGLVHRDIKPSNIMLCEQGGIPDFVKVLDFGLARSIHRTDNGDVTQLGLVAGTPLYMAPERITNPTTIDQRSDLYSFGAVGYYLLTGRGVHDASANDDMLRQVLHETPRRPSEVTNNPIPAEFEALIVRCLAKNLEDRPATMKEVMASIARLEVDFDQSSGDI